VARIRTIKPEFWVDEQIVELDYVTRLLFIGIWNFVDDEGYLEYKPRRIKMQIFPADDLDISREIQNLLEANRLLYFTSDQGDLLRVANWSRHQKISNPTATKFTSIQPGESSKQQASAPISLESSVPLQKVLDGSVLKGKEGKGIKDLSTDGEPPSDKPKVPYSDLFLKWWSHYPRKESKGAAWNAWEKLRKAHQLPAVEILAPATIAYAQKMRGKESQFIKLPAGWLNDRKWEDEASTATNRPKTDWMNAR